MMADADVRTSRPARRHAHVCRTCDATFGCKAELLEHEQEEHTRVQNKAVRRKPVRPASMEVKQLNNEDVTSKKQSVMGNKMSSSSVVGDIAIDHEEVYDESNVLSSLKLLKKNSQKLATMAPKLTVGANSQGNLSGTVSKPKERHDQTKQFPISVPEVGSRFTNKPALHASKLEQRSSVHDVASPIPIPSSIQRDYNEIGIVKEVIEMIQSVGEAERNKHQKHSPVDVRTVLGLKRKHLEDFNSLDSNDVNNANKKKSDKTGLDATQEISRLSVHPQLSSNDELRSDSQLNVDFHPNASKNSACVNLSHDTVTVELESSTKQTPKSEVIKETDQNSQNYVVVETQPASDMYIDSAECSNEVTVVETPSNKAIKKRVQNSPKVTPVCLITPMQPPVNNSSAGNTKRMIALTVAPSTPRMVSVLLRNRDNKTGISPDAEAKTTAHAGVPKNADGNFVHLKAQKEDTKQGALEEKNPEESPVELCDAAKEDSSGCTLSVSRSCATVDSILKTYFASNTPTNLAVSPPSTVSIVLPVNTDTNREVANTGESQLLPDAETLIPQELQLVASLSDNICEQIISKQNTEIGAESSVDVKHITPSSEDIKTDTAVAEEDSPDLCKLCKKKFEDNSDMKKHLLSDHVCQQCGKEFRQTANLRKHIRVSHENVRPHQCPVCGKGFAFASNLSAHLPVHFQYEDGEEKQFACTQCDRTFKHSASLRKHTKEEHVVGPKPHVCPHCNKSFVFKCALDCHMRKHSGFRPFTCATCGTGFKHLSNLQKHVKVLHPGPCSICMDETQQCEHAQAARAALKAKFTCVECNRSYDSAASLAVHIRVHTGEKPETCHICGRSFQHRSNLQKHMMKHAGRKPHACPVCPRAFYARHNLIAHMRKHTGNSPHECKTCGKRFCTKNSLQVHMNLHANVRPFACDVCGRQFSQLGNLQKHMSVHTGERPHVCPECKRSFTDVSALKRHHAAIHERDARYACEICDKRFLHLSSVRSHRLLHTGVKPHKCETCGKAFTHKSGFLRHVRLHDRPNSGVISAIVGSDKEVVLKPGEYIVYLTE